MNIKEQIKEAKIEVYDLSAVLIGYESEIQKYNNTYAVPIRKKLQELNSKIAELSKELEEKGGENE